MRTLPVGIQLYTVRDELKSDFRGTLAAVAELGFAGVEFAWNYGDMAPGELARFLEGLGLTCCGLHEPVEKLMDPKGEAYAYAEGLNAPFVTTSLAGAVDGDWPTAIESARKAAEVAATRGRRFTYHNHSQEFAEVDGVCALDMMFERTPRDTVQAEFDIGWAAAAGQPPLPYLRKLAGRVPQVHLRDITPDTREITDIGAGVIDIPGVIRSAPELGVEWIIYEQDNYPVSPMESTRACARYLRDQGFMAT